MADAFEFNAYILEDIVPDAPDFATLEAEIQWMSDATHRGGPLPRCFAIQVDAPDPHKLPLYRHPVDKLTDVVAMTPNVRRIRDFMPGFSKLNHAVIRMYRDGKDYVSEHCDKSMDIVPGTSVVTYSIGGPRTMTFRSKTPISDTEKRYKIHQLTMGHNSALVMDVDGTNRLYRHSVHRDQRNEVVVNPRISITFRAIGTFLDPETNDVSGLGVPSDVDDPGYTNTEIVHQWGLQNRTMQTRDELYSRGFRGTYIKQDEQFNYTTFPEIRLRGSTIRRRNSREKLHC